MSVNRIDAFITLINQTFCDSAKKDELMAIWKQVNHFDVCKSMVRSGERKGQACGKPCIKEQPHCLCHMPRPPKKEAEHRQKCISTYENGKNCLRFCLEGKDMCAFHSQQKPLKCTYTLVRGERSGKTCEKPCHENMTVCRSHSKKA